MQDFGTKADNSPPPGGQLSAAEFNNLATELENAVLRSGQALDGASTNQLATAAFITSTKAQTFQDSGAANAYVATPTSGMTGVALPTNYTNLDGCVIVFLASNANTGASTLNIGQTTGTLLGVKAIVDQTGAALTSGSIAATSYIQLRYDASIGSGSWVLMPWAKTQGQATETTAGSIRIATQAETTAGVIDTKAVTPAKMRFGFAFSLGTTGYITLPTWLGGFIMQWGRVTLSDAAKTTVSFSVTFPQQCVAGWTGLFGDFSGDVTNGRESGIAALANASALISYNDNNGGSSIVSWFVIGA